MSENRYNNNESASYNSGWESFFIDREISDNPHTKDTQSYVEWRSGFLAAKRSSAGE